MKLTMARCVAALGLLASACGGSDSDQAETEPPATESTQAESANPEPADTEPADTEPESESESESESTASAEWDGPNAAELLNARMDELAAVYGQPLTAAAVAPLFPIADDFPYPAGNITGVFSTWDRDRRITDEIRIDLEYLIGLDGDPSEAALDAIADSVGEGSGSRWSRSSAQRQEDQAFNDLFTAEDGDGDGNTDRIVLRGDADHDPGEPLVQVKVETTTQEIPVPAWAAGLPTLPGGELDEVTEGRGIVSIFGGWTGADGHISLRWFYPVERYDELGEYLSSGVLTSAGFSDDGSTNSNLDFRTDLSMDGWEGTVAVGEYSIDSELAGYHLYWTLTREG